MIKEFEDELRTIVNHPLRAYGMIHFGTMEKMDKNSTALIACLKEMGSAIKSLSPVDMAIWAAMLALAILRIVKHIIFLAFYPGFKIYFILRVRNALRREHPEYIARK